MSEWKEYKLSELMELIGGGTPKTTVPEYWGGDIPWLSVTDFNNGRKYCNDAEKRITERGLKESSTKILKKGQIIISARGTVGVVSMLGKDMAFNQSNYGIDSNRKLTSNNFLYYLLKDNIANFISNSYGAVFDTITKETFNQINVAIPDIKEQNTIAEVLSSLDDKIDLLHRQNKTLEQIAEALFRQWFVEEAEEDWEGKSLDEIAEFLNGLACQKYPVKIGEEGLPVIKIKELRTGITDASDLATKDIPEKYLVNDGDMLFSWSGSLDILIWSGGKGVLNQHLFKVSSEQFPQWFYYFWIKHHLPEFQGIAEDKATTMGHIQRHHLISAKVLIPKEIILTEMDEKINPIFNKIKINQIQIRTLTKLRETLLPKLMSGEVKIRQDEQ